MFDVGFFELLLLGVIGLLVLGPERLPKVARTIGLWVGKIKGTISSVQSEIEREIHNHEIMARESEIAKELEQMKSSVEQDANAAKTSTEALTEETAATATSEKNNG